MKKAIIIVLAAVCVISGSIWAKTSITKLMEEKEYEQMRESMAQIQESSVAPPEAKEEKKTETLSAEDAYVPAPYLSSLMKKNDSVIGWLKIGGTNVDYPIAQNREDNEYFLHRDINGKDSYAGSIYLDSNHDVNQAGLHVIYGHHMKNGTMFKDISKFVDKDYMKEHSDITIFTDKKEIHLVPVCCYVGGADGSYRSEISSQEELGDFFESKTGARITGNVFVFITCEYSAEDNRTYLIAREK